MYYAKYIKYKNKYLNLKYQLGGQPRGPTAIVPSHQSKPSFLEKLSKSPKPSISQKPSDSSNPELPKPVYSLKQKLIKYRLKNINIPPVYENLENIDKSLKENLVGIKILESDSVHLEPMVKYNQQFKSNPIYFYRFTDKDGKVYILCSLYSYFEFLDILYEHIEIEEINIDEKGIITPKLERIYHIIPKPKDIVVKPKQTISIPIKPNIYSSNIKKLVDDLSINFFIIITSNQLLLNAICMYNLFIGTIHVFVINIDKSPSTFFLLSLFTEYELMQYIDKQPNIELYECRLFKQGDKIEFILNKKFVAMMFKKYQDLKLTDHYAEKLIRGNSAINNRLLDELDSTLLENCSRCISVEDIAFNTTLFLLPEKIKEIEHHKDILEIKKDFLERENHLLNNNNKIFDWKYGNKNLERIREFNFEEIKKEIKVLKEKLLGLEPSHQQLLVQKLKELGFEGYNMQEILDNSALCYLDEKDKYKRLLYELPIQIDTDTKFVKQCKFIPEMKRLLDTSKNPESELHKYRQTILFLIKDNQNEKNYSRNQLYFFVDSFHLTRVPTFDKIFELFGWNYNLNKLCFQCLAMRDWLIFPIRIINIKYLQSPFSFEFDIKKQEFCGFLHTRFTNNFNGDKNFSNECADKLLFLYYQPDYTSKYRLFHFTGNSIHTKVSTLSNYKVSANEINWIYYTFIMKEKNIPHFYEYSTESFEKEIVVSKFSLEEIRCKYEENGYDLCELGLLTEVFYNYKYYKGETNKLIFLKNSLFISKEEENKFVKNVLQKYNTK